MIWKAALFYILLGQPLSKFVFSFAFRKDSQNLNYIQEVLTNSGHHSRKYNKMLNYMFLFLRIRKDQREEDTLILDNSEYEEKYSIYILIDSFSNYLLSTVSSTIVCAEDPAKGQRSES